MTGVKAAKKGNPGPSGWKSATIGLWLAVTLLWTACPAVVRAETLADVDADIQRGNTSPIRIAGQAAVNVYTDVSGNPNVLLERKVAILREAGITNFASSGAYSNFYSFTGKMGYTDTKIDLVTTQAVTRLYRRGTSGRQETQSYLGSWWSGSYLGVEATRNGQAVLAAWGSDLQRIYVVAVPAGTTLVGGLASPMEQGGEYRAGGAYQYYYRGAPRSWLLYALYAPDYLKSYSAAVSGAQRLGFRAMDSLSEHLEEARHRAITDGGSASLERKAAEPVADSGKKAMRPANQDGFWMKYYQGDSTVADGMDRLGGQFQGGHLGWERRVSGPEEKYQRHWGFLLGQGQLDQTVQAGGVQNHLTHTYAGVYEWLQSPPDAPRVVYHSLALLYGRLRMDNRVPGEMGYGLRQKYNGNLLSVSAESGVTFRQSRGWLLEPQLQLFYAKVLQSEFEDQLGAPVTLRHAESLTGRAGLLAQRRIVTRGGKISRFWLKASYLHEFSGRNRVDVAGDADSSGGGRNKVQLNVGVSAAMSAQWRVRAEVSRFFGDETGYGGGILFENSW